MLKQRVITASVMMLVFLGLLFFPPWQAFLSCITLVFVVGAWEWSSLTGITNFAFRIAYVLVLSAIGYALFQLSSYGVDSRVLTPVLILACAWWALVFVWVRIFPIGESIIRSRFMRALLGGLVLVPAWLSVSFLIQQANGALLVLFGLLIVASVDVGAYFTGRRFGKRKLAPVVSPGKSWEGVWGGLVFAMLIAVVFVSVFGELQFPQLLLVVLPAALVSVVGDLFESMVKRIRGVKDSGVILPGHGGVLDRIDGLTSAIPVYSFAILSTGWAL